MKKNVTLFDKKFVIATLNLEQRALNFKNLTYNSEKALGVCQRYFRSSLTRRLIGNEILARTIAGEWSTQAFVRKKFKMSKGQVSLVFNDCVQADWFVKDNSEKNGSTQPHYQAAKIMITSIEIYQKYIWQGFDEDTIKTFLEHLILQKNMFRNETNTP